MTPKELAWLCADAIAAKRKTVLLTVPHKPTRHGALYLIGFGTPRAVDVICVNAKGESVGRWKAKSVLKWVNAVMAEGM